MSSFWTSARAADSCWAVFSLALKFETSTPSSFLLALATSMLFSLARRLRLSLSRAPKPNASPPLARLAFSLAFSDFAPARFSLLFAFSFSEAEMAASYSCWRSYALRN